MSGRKTSFWRESGRTYLLYMASGMGAIPAGVVYAVLTANDWDRWWTTIPLLVVGVGMALTAWKFAERWWLPAVPATISGPEQPVAYEAGHSGIRPTIKQTNLPKTSR
jgi:hypothetical protein